MQDPEKLLRERRRNPKRAVPAPNDSLISETQSLWGGMAVREGGRAEKRKEERERKNKALLSRAEGGCTRQHGSMAGSKQRQLLREGISGDCLQRSVQDTGKHRCFGTLLPSTAQRPPSA